LVHRPEVFDHSNGTHFKLYHCHSPPSIVVTENDKKMNWAFA
jgi:hypothetical protein